MWYFSWILGTRASPVPRIQLKYHISTDSRHRARPGIRRSQRDLVPDRSTPAAYLILRGFVDLRISGSLTIRPTKLTGSRAEQAAEMARQMALVGKSRGKCDVGQ